MPGNSESAKKAWATKKQRYGLDYGSSHARKMSEARKIHKGFTSETAKQASKKRWNKD